MTTGDKIKKSVIYILLVLLAAACLFPFLLMMVNAIMDTIYKGCLPHWKHPSQVRSVDAF